MLPVIMGAKLRYEAPQADVVMLEAEDIVSSSITEPEDYAPEEQNYTAQHRF